MLVFGVLALIILYLNRQAAAREVLTRWFDSQGIAARVQVDRIEIDRFVGRIRIGDPRDPDAVIERVEVDYAVAGPWATGGLGLKPSRIRLVHPVVRATWADGRLSFGALDPLIKTFTARPSKPDSRGPLILVEGGRLRLDSAYGSIPVQADARIDDGRLMQLGAVLPSISLRHGDVQTQGLAGRVTLATTGDRVALALDLTSQAFALGGLSGAATHLSGRGDLPYPDLKTHKGDGRAIVDLNLTSARFGMGGLAAREAAARLTFDGQTAGWIDVFRIAGHTDGTIEAAALSGNGLSLTGGRLTLTQTGTEVSRTTTGLGWGLHGPASLRAASASVGSLSLTGLTARADLDAAHHGATRISADGSLQSTGGAWPLFGPVKADDVVELAEMKRALGDFSVSVPALRLQTDGAGTRVTLGGPARLSPANGGVLTVNPVARPIFAASAGERGGGALSLTATRGRGLPQATVTVPDWRLTPGGFEARLNARAALDFGIARGLTLATAGLLSSDRGTLSYVAPGCATFAARSLELGKNDVADVAGRFCPNGRPLVVVRQGGWRADGRIAAVSATAPFLAMSVREAAGTVGVTGTPSGLGLVARIVSARIADTTDPRRFNPLGASGSASLNDQVWTGDFDLTSGSHAVGQVTLSHNGKTETGGVIIDAPSLIFAPGALQPAVLTPMVDGIVSSPVTGSVSFKGRFDWSPALIDGSSSGRLIIPSLDFVSPAGPVKGLSGTVDFTSLAPLITAPNQRLRLATLESVTPLTDLDLTFGLDAAAITVSGGAIQAAGGVVSVEPFSVPLDPTSNRTGAFDGVIVFDHIQLGDLITGSGFEDKVALDAVVSGRLPFTFDPAKGIRISAGSLAATQAGRLSIQREVLSGLQAGGGGEIPPGTVEDLAYQAMQNLAFDVLTADVNSLDQGRVSVLFHIKGRHDPPQHQELRLTLPELISREFLSRPLPLPSDTGIDLTLDTTLNLNQLISDLLEVDRQRRGLATVPSQPPP